VAENHQSFLRSRAQREIPIAGMRSAKPTVAHFRNA
jgi:hypothetical protein